VKPTFGKTLGDGCADVVSGADDQTDGFFSHFVAYAASAA